MDVTPFSRVMELLDFWEEEPSVHISTLYLAMAKGFRPVRRDVEMRQSSDPEEVRMFVAQWGGQSKGIGDLPPWMRENLNQLAREQQEKGGK